MEINYRKKIIRTLTFLGGLYFFLEFLLPKVALEAVGVADYHDQISYGFIVFGAMAIGLGIINLFMVHGSKIVFQRKDWTFSFVLLAGLLIMMTSTALEWRQGLSITNKVRDVSMLADFSNRILQDYEKQAKNIPQTSERISALKRAASQVLTNITPIQSQQNLFNESDVRHRLFNGYQAELRTLIAEAEQDIRSLPEGDTPDKERHSSLSRNLNLVASVYGKMLRLLSEKSFVKELYSFLYSGLFVALGSAMFSLLGVYIAAAAYRAFRVRSFESGLMMTAAVIVMLGQIPFGLYIYAGLPEWRLWLMEVPNSAAFRAIKIGASIAGLVMAFRMWLSIESESFSEERS